MAIRRRLAAWLGPRDLTAVGPVASLLLVAGGVFGGLRLLETLEARWPDSLLVTAAGGIMILGAAAGGFVVGMLFGQRLSVFVGSLVYDEFRRLYLPFRERVGGARRPG